MKHVLLLVVILLFAYTMLLIYNEPVSKTRLSEEEIMNYIEKRDFPGVDLVLMSPCVTYDELESQQTINYSLVSVLRFAPWIRRIHLHTPSDSSPLSYTEYTKNDQARIVSFSQDLLTYSLTTPWLAEHFLILHAGYIITNYIFSWQFFVNNSVVARSCTTGLYAMTRTLFNECAFFYDRKDPNQPLTRLIGHAWSLPEVQYKSNQDHFIAACTKQPITTTKKIQKFRKEDVEALLRFEEPLKKHDQPYELVVAIIHDSRDYLHFNVKPEFARNIQVWVVLDDVAHRLSLLHRMAAHRHLFIEIARSKRSTEDICAFIMKQLKSLVNNQEFRVIHIFGPAGDVVGNRMCQVYDCVFDLFIDRQKDEEYERLRFL